MLGKMVSGVGEQIEKKECQVFVVQIVCECIDNIVVVEEDIVDIVMWLGGNVNFMVDGELDYFVLVDVVCVLQDKLILVGDKLVIFNELFSSEDIISMLLIDMGKFIEGDVLIKLQDWLNSLLLGELLGDIQVLLL